jgi:glutamate-1-semialdehyde 2,1-aminomutase
MEDRILFGVGVTEGEVDLARKIVEHVPSVDKALLCNSGSEATFHALRVSRAVTGRERVVKFQGHYNGFHDYLLMNVVTEPSMLGKRDPASAGMLRAAVEATDPCRFNDLDDVERHLAREDVAALIIEPAAHNSPGILPVPGFLEGLRSLCDRYGTVLIFDEVITGFRHGLGGYQAIAGVTPDLTTMGKAIANGYPLAVVGGKAEIMDRYNTHPDGDVQFGGTYNGNGIGVAAALATIAELEAAPVHEHIFRLGDRMREGLAKIGDAAGIPYVVSGYGSLFILLFMEGPLLSFDDAVRGDSQMFVRYREELIKRGVFEEPLSYGRSHISYSHTDEDIDRSLEIAEEALRATLAAKTP